MFDYVSVNMTGTSTHGYTSVSYNSTLDTVSVMFGTHRVKLSVLDAAALADAITTALDTYTADLQVVF
ncbi:hypothetical protein [Nocardia asteroides]|uniref:hypothetical protein n=1 Tax=Nocardia asteroides TaxID=1824 RepID=UPI00365DB0D6